MTTSIYFDMEHLDRFSIIDEPCAGQVRNGTNLRWDGIYTGDGHDRWIVTLRAITQDNFDILKKRSEDTILTYYEASKYFLTGALWESQVRVPEDLPIKGEYVGCVFDYVDGELRCTNLSTIPRKKPKEYIHSVAVERELTDLNALLNGLKDEY